jgi:two-component system, OmpR family, response regulator
MKVLLIENDFVTALAVSRRFAEEAIAADHAEDAAAGLDLGRAGGYDAIVVDRGLPDGDGLDVVKQLRGEGNATPVVMLSAWTTTQARIEALRNGADAYLNKPCDVTEIVAQVGALTKRTAAANGSTILRLGDLSLDLMTHGVVRAGVSIPLLPREFQILRELMRNAGSVVSRAAFWEAIWGYRFDPGTGVLEVHIARLRVKIDRGYRERLIHTVRGVGYMIRSEEALAEHALRVRDFPLQPGAGPAERLPV